MSKFYLKTFGTFAFMRYFYNVLIKTATFDILTSDTCEEQENAQHSD